MKQLLSYKSVVAMATAMFALSCTQEDLYNPKEHAANENPLKITTTDDFSWQMVAPVNVNVAKSNAGGYSFGVEIFGENPATNPDAVRLAAGTGSLANPFVASVAQSTALGYVYAKLTFSNNDSEIRRLYVNSNLASTNFGRKAGKAVLANPDVIKWPAAAASENFATAESVASLQPVANLQTGNSGNYLIDATTSAVNLWSGTSHVYVSGRADFSASQFYTCSNTSIHVLPGATLVVSPMCLSQSGTNVYVSNGGAVVCTGALELGYGSNLYNRGTIEAERLSASSNGVIYNEADGTIKVAKRLSVENSQSCIVNDGKVEAGEVNTAGSGHIQNSGKVVVEGQTLINSNDNVWHNDGEWVTNDFTYNANSHNVTNNCRMYVKNLFKTVLGDGDGFFQNNGGAYVECRNLYANSSEFHLGSKSLFRVTDTATMGYNKPDRGFIGAGDDYAVLETGKTVMENAYQGYSAVYSGNLIVDFDEHFAQGYSGQYPYYLADETVIMTQETADFSIESTECNPGYNPVPEKEDVTIPFTTYFSNIYAFEDNWPEFGDFDMNDVIIKLDIETSGSSKEGDSIIRKAIIRPTILANGADYTLATGVQFDAIGMDEASCRSFESGQEKPVIVLKQGITGYINVDDVRSDGNYITVDPVEVEFPEGIRPSQINVDNVNVFITVNQSGLGTARREIHMKGFKGTSLAEKVNSPILSPTDDYCSADNFPWGIVMPGNSHWVWPNELVPITDVSGEFVKWVVSGGAKCVDWYCN